MRVSNNITKVGSITTLLTVLTLEDGSPYDPPGNVVGVVLYPGAVAFTPTNPTPGSYSTDMDASIPPLAPNNVYSITLSIVDEAGTTQVLTPAVFL